MSQRGKDNFGVQRALFTALLASNGLLERTFSFFRALGIAFRNAETQLDRSSTVSADKKTSMSCDLEVNIKWGVSSVASTALKHPREKNPPTTSTCNQSTKGVSKSHSKQNLARNYGVN